MLTSRIIFASMVVSLESYAGVMQAAKGCIMKWLALLVVVLVGVRDITSLVLAAPDKPYLQPIEPPKKAEEDADVAKIKVILEVGRRQRIQKIEALKRVTVEPYLYPAVQRALKSLSRSRTPYLPSLKRFTVGEVGVLRDSAVYSTMLGAVKVVQIIDDDSMLIKYDIRYDEVCWLEGFPTAGLVDGDIVKGIASLLEVTGTKQFKTALGASRTVFVLEPFGLDHDLDKERATPRRRGKTEVAESPAVEKKPRTWTDSGGQFKVLATFLSFGNGNVKLQRADDGKAIAVPFDRLSKGDQEWVTAYRKGTAPP